MRTFLLTILLMGLSVQAADEPAKVQLAATIDQVLATVADKTLDSSGRRGKIRVEATRRFALPQISALVVGSHWKGLAEKDKNDFVEAFTETLLDSYMRKIETYNGETVQYLATAVEGNKAQVDTTLTGGGKVTPVVYKMVSAGDEWKVYDVVIDGVSLVKTYRTQYGDFLASKPFSELLVTMKDKLKDSDKN